MRNDILNVIKKQNWDALENFGFENKWGQKNIKFIFFCHQFFFQIRSFECHRGLYHDAT